MGSQWKLGTVWRGGGEFVVFCQLFLGEWVVILGGALRRQGFSLHLARHLPPPQVSPRDKYLSVGADPLRWFFKVSLDWVWQQAPIGHLSLAPGPTRPRGWGWNVSGLGYNTSNLVHVFFLHWGWCLIGTIVFSNSPFSCLLPFKAPPMEPFWTCFAAAGAGSAAPVVAQPGCLLLLAWQVPSGNAL